MRHGFTYQYYPYPKPIEFWIKNVDNIVWGDQNKIAFLNIPTIICLKQNVVYQDDKMSWKEKEDVLLT